MDIEANGLENPDRVLLVVCKNIRTGEYEIFRDLDDENERRRFLEFDRGVRKYIGHNLLGYDLPVLRNIIDVSCGTGGGSGCALLDTLIVSKLANYSRKKHSVEAYGEEFGLGKITFSDFSKYSKELEEYCIRDVDITEKIWNYYSWYLNNPSNEAAIKLEHDFQFIVNSLSNNGFYFDTSKADKLLQEVKVNLSKLDADILKSFPPKEKVIRTFTPKATKFGTISLSSVPKALRNNIKDYEVGKTYNYTKLEPFNPSSHKQIVDVLHEAGWKPVNKTKTHIQTERELNKLKYSSLSKQELDIRTFELYNTLQDLRKYGWKIDEENLQTLPESAPPSARTLAKRILLESRRRTLTEWLELVDRRTDRIHGKFYGIGAWTHRMAHQHPNTANIPTGAKLYGDEMRSLWSVPKNRLLVGVDAEGIQLRIFAHYIDDPEFTDSLVRGRKDDKTDPHSLNQRILGSHCRSRQTAKRFIYALLLGAGIGKLAEILECSTDEAKESLSNLVERYQGFEKLKQEVIPADAERGYFIGLDGRQVPIPGDDPGIRRHLCMSGYLQNGEAVVMKKACLLWHDMLREEGISFTFVNFVHDEWQTEVPDDWGIARKVAMLQAESLKIAGEQLKLKCPLAGSYWNDDHKDYTIGKNWSVTH